MTRPYRNSARPWKKLDSLLAPGPQPVQRAPEISFIVSAYDRPNRLRTGLAALADQSHADFEVLVTDNARDDKLALAHSELVRALNDRRFRYYRTFGETKICDCYWSAEWGAQRARGRWLAFPCDDTYYPPEYAARMLAAAYTGNAEFVICGKAVVGPEACGNCGYHVWDMAPGRATKTTFMILAAKFEGFAGKPVVEGAAGAVDYSFSAETARRLRTVLVPDLLLVHN